MKFKNKLPIILICIAILMSCNDKKSPVKITTNFLKDSLKRNTEIKLKNWHFKDIEIDTIPGISLERAYDSLIVNKKGEEVIVAIIDTEIDINHTDFSGNIWCNKNEIPNNSLDDDYNGYVDDTNGWNFIGNLKGKNIFYSNLECVRIIQKFKNDSISLKKTKEYETYSVAKEYYEEELKRALSDQEYGNFLFKGYPKAKEALKRFFPDENYTTSQLDSIYKENKTKNEELSKNAYFLSDFIKYNLSEEWIANYKRRADNTIKTTLNLNYYDRKEIDNDPSNIGFANYGNPYVNKNISEFYHGTLVAGLVCLNNFVVDSSKINNTIKIMPLAISSNGEEHDKDIALAIRYAVDNGANVINMSFGKHFSLHKEWVFDAFKYAEKNNVLIVSSTGNSKINLNINNNYYPNDNINNGKEVSDNFLLVGSISNRLDKSLFSYFSNYGNIDVDFFAPGEKIYTTLPNNKYKFDSGTSLASAITSGVAALLYSYYPTLSASQVKHILMDSGLEYTIPVSTPTKEDKEKTTPFNQLSKSGKVLNAYNALIMADSIARN